jgi:hypothetical protein
MAAFWRAVKPSATGSEDIHRWDTFSPAAGIIRRGRIMRTLTVFATLTIAVGVLAGAATAAPEVTKTKVCGQITHGPYANWVIKAPGQPQLRLVGTAWTVFATGRISCATAMTVGKTLLARYPAARKRSTGAIKPMLEGFDTCGTKSGQANCYDRKHSSNVTLFETGTYSLAQIKQLVASGKLPLGKR